MTNIVCNSHHFGFGVNGGGGGGGGVKREVARIWLFSNNGMGLRMKNFNIMGFH